MRRIHVSAIFLFVLTLLFLTYNIANPTTQNFDEFHYIPAVEKWLAGQADPNIEHPPLAKLMISASIRVFGNHSFGWRIGSAIAGSLTMVAFFYAGYYLFQSYLLSLSSCLLLFLNQLFFVQSRIAMLDPYMMMFLVFALACFVKIIRSEEFKNNHIIKMRKELFLLGLCLGFAMATKWFSIIVSFVFVSYLVYSWRDVLNKKHSYLIFYSLVLVPGLIYFLCFLPTMLRAGRSPIEFFALQFEMLSAQRRVVSAHPYTSEWYTWPLMLRPIWYHFAADPKIKELHRGIALIGNPLLMWSGLLAIAYLIYDVWRFSKNKISVYIIFFYFSFWLAWAVIPRKINFYYYYYPASFFLNWAIVWAFYRIIQKAVERRDDVLNTEEKINFYFKRYMGFFLFCSFVVFVYFFPILSGLKILPSEFQAWTWFKGWI